MGARLAFILFLVMPLSCEKQEPQPAPDTTLSAAAQTKEFQAEIQNFCSHCHICPQPDILTKEAWRMQIPREYGHFEQVPDQQLRVPPLPVVIEYFVSQAPAAHQLPEQIEQPLPGPIHFRQQIFPNPVQGQLPAVSDLNWRPRNSKAGELLITDLGSGTVGRMLFEQSEPTYQRLAALEHPSHIERFDLNGDQHDDYLIADLGSFGPEDHDRGKVTLLVFDKTTKDWHPLSLQTGLGRVADVKAADFDDDGDLDLIVAEFGWRKTGRLLYLKNVSASPTELKFEPEVLDDRHGASHVLTTDFNNDGRLDFVVLFSQEHEIIVAFLNQGAGRFKTETVFQAPDPAYGSSSLSLVDLDQDGDQDLLYTNGDTMDSFDLRPSHSLQWLENRGAFPFTHHHITDLTGAYGATHGDFDNDGDIDLAACTMTWDYAQPRNTVVWYEQRAPGEFIPHPLDYSYGQHAVIETGDFDADGDLDLAVGNFEPRETEHAQPNDWFSIWWNEGPRNSK